MTTFNWTGTGGTKNQPVAGTWDATTITNWSPNGIPAVGDTVDLGGNNGAASAYIVTLGVYDKIYGPLGALVALSMFAYYSGIVFVLGAEFAAAFCAGRRARG